ncbi:transcription factor PAR1-like [Aristolochia californica]|uniref:transcription factor PAR1-like n=1 Tax=Aristolochia californica TaxID=171875 RepID=UPI0035DD20E0
MVQPPHFHHMIRECSLSNKVSLIRRSRTLRRKRRHACCCSQEPAGSKFDGESDDERAEVERKIAALQRLVPGGESLEVDKLFEETAEYILALEGKVISMKLLTNLFEGLQKEETKVGG